MLHTDRKTYEAPTILELGAMKDITEAGNQARSDAFQGEDGTAWEPGS